MKPISKSIVTVLIAVVLGLNLNQFIVRADVIIEPRDQFYEEHSEECDYTKRTYFANAKPGYVNLYKNPTSNVIVTTATNKSEFFITFTYTDQSGDVWGCVDHSEVFKDSSYTSGWVNLKDLTVEYDTKEFVKDHKDQIVEKPLHFALNELKDTVYMWTYPYSGEISCKIDPTTEYANGCRSNYDSYYEDEKGRAWIYLDYYMASSGWICTTDPTNADMGKDKSHEIKFYAAASPSIAGQFQTETILILVGILIITAGTAAMIHKIYRKEKRK